MRRAKKDVLWETYGERIVAVSADTIAYYKQECDDFGVSYWQKTELSYDIMKLLLRILQPQMEEWKARQPKRDYMGREIKPEATP
jgi:hypothetical protein